MVEWKRNLVFVWLSQFFSIAGFSLSLSFSAYYIQDLGIVDEDAIKFWAALSVAAPAVGLAIMAPVWGVLADRFGRKPMMLRANLGAAVVLGSMAFAPTAFVFVLLRVCQGFLTGTMNAAMTFVASYSPKAKQGMALGTISSAVYSGGAVGPFLGGFIADAFGYRSAFMFSTAALLLSILFIMFGLNERFVIPTREGRQGTPGLRRKIVALGPGLAILILLCMTAFARRFDQAILPLYVQELCGGLEGASRWMGFVLGAAALGAILGGIVLGRLADRASAAGVGKVSAVAAGGFQMLIGIVPGFLFMIPSRFFMAFWAAGLDPVFLAWLSRVTPEEKRGVVFGWSVTAKSIGWAVTPMVSAGVAVWFGVRAVFMTGCIFFLLLVPMVAFVIRRVADRK